jgi:hypothetical protein
VSRRLVTLGLALLLAALALQLAACGTNDDPYTGLWWEPSSGLRLEIRKDGGAYTLQVGTDLQRYTAEARGEELYVARSQGGDITVKQAPEGRLDLVIGGTSNRLQRAPQHQ